MSEFHLDEKRVCASGLCTGVDEATSHKSRSSHGENSCPRDSGRVVIITNGTTSDCITEAVLKLVLQRGSEQLGGEPLPQYSRSGRWGP